MEILSIFLFCVLVIFITTLILDRYFNNNEKIIVPPGVLWTKEELNKLEEYHNKALKHIDMLKKKEFSRCTDLFKEASKVFEPMYKQIEAINTDMANTKKVLLLTEHNSAYIQHDEYGKFTIITGHTFNKPENYELAYYIHPAIIRHTTDDNKILLLLSRENIHNIPSDEFEKSMYSINDNGEKVITIVEVDNVDGGIIDVVINDVYPR